MFFLHKVTCMYVLLVILIGVNVCNTGAAF